VNIYRRTQDGRSGVNKHLVAPYSPSWLALPGSMCRAHGSLLIGTTLNVEGLSSRFDSRLLAAVASATGVFGSSGSVKWLGGKLYRGVAAFFTGVVTLLWERVHGRQKLLQEGLPLLAIDGPL
jgi:hypothetical protein